MNTEQIKKHIVDFKWWYVIAIVVLLGLVYFFVFEKDTNLNTENGAPYSIDPDLLDDKDVSNSLLSIYPATSTRYVNSKQGFSFVYTSDLKLITDIDKSVFNFHESYRQGNSITEATLVVQKTIGSCELWSDGESKFNTSKTETFGNNRFEIRNVIDSSGSSNIYEKEYSLVKDGQCYRILYTDIQDKTNDNQIIKRNNDSRQSMLKIVESLLATFTI